MNEKFYIWLEFQLVFFPKCPNDNKSGLIHGNGLAPKSAKPLPEPVLTQFTEAYIGH